MISRVKLCKGKTRWGERCVKPVALMGFCVTCYKRNYPEGILKLYAGTSKHL